MPLPNNKLAVIHLARQKLGLDDDAYRDMLRNVVAVNSSTELDEIGFDVLMVHFQTLGFQSDWCKRNFGYRAGMASPKQVAYIRAVRFWSSSWQCPHNESKGLKWMSKKSLFSATFV